MTSPIAVLGIGDRVVVLAKRMLFTADFQTSVQQKLCKSEAGSYIMLGMSASNLQ